MQLTLRCTPLTFTSYCTGNRWDNLIGHTRTETRGQLPLKQAKALQGQQQCVRQCHHTSNPFGGACSIDARIDRWKKSLYTASSFCSSLRIPLSLAHQPPKRSAVGLQDRGLLEKRRQNDLAKRNAEFSNQGDVCQLGSHRAAYSN